MISKDDINKALEEFYENDEPIIDLTDGKTFLVAAIISIICGFCIGYGYQLIFTTIDCSNVIYSNSGVPLQVCFPNVWGQHKLTIMIITLITGILVGASPRIIRILHDDNTPDEDSTEEDES